MSERSSKIIFGLLVVILVAILAFVFLIQGRLQEPAISIPVVPSPASTTVTAASETPSFKPVSSFLSPKEIQQQLDAVQNQINRGVLTPEEGQKQKDAIGVRMTPPTQK